jgi:hypothetical protein
VSGTAGQAIANASLLIDVGGAKERFTITGKNKGSAPLGQVRLKLKTSRDKSFAGGDIAISVSLKRGAWTSIWSDDGFENSTVKKIALTVPVEIAFLGFVYRSEVPVLYSAKIGASGSLKQ